MIETGGTPDRHWANDPTSNQDHTHALAALDEHHDEHARTGRLVRLGAPRTRLNPTTLHANNPHGPPPF